MTEGPRAAHRCRDARVAVAPDRGPQIWASKTMSWRRGRRCRLRGSLKTLLELGGRYGRCITHGTAKNVRRGGAPPRVAISEDGQPRLRSINVGRDNR